MIKHLHKGLASDSEVYKNLSETYDRFSQTEDSDGAIFEELRSLIKGKELVLDLGCGTGKYLELLSPYANNLIGIDASLGQLSVAKKKTLSCQNITLIHGDAAEIDLSNYKFDIIFSSWVLHTIRDEKKRLQVIESMMERLVVGGIFFLIENDSKGECEEIRNRTESSKDYNNWLQNFAGFVEHKKLNTRFVFENISEAKSIFAEIWGDEVANKIQSREIKHNVVIFKRQR